MNPRVDIGPPPPCRIALLALLALLVGGCISFGEATAEDREWVEEYARATTHDPAEAEEILARLAETAPDEQKRRDAEFDRARMALKRGDARTAYRRFEALYEERPDDHVASRSLYEMGRIAAEHDGDYGRARRLLRRAVVETAPRAGAELALQFLVRTETERDRTEALVDELAAMGEATDEDRMASQIHLERGLLLDERLGRPDDALRAYSAAHRRCRDSAATDEALYQMGRIYVRLQQWDPALQALEIVADRTDRSWFVGTYSSQRAADARLLMGFVELVYRRNYGRAADHFEEFLDWFDDHPDADRVAWYLVDIRRLEDSTRSYRRALREFVDDYPDSRYVERARRRLEEVS